MNLLDETMQALTDNGKSTIDVQWVGCDEFQISLMDFIHLANIEYDNGFGEQLVAKDLILVGEDFILTRSNYDGAEGWVMTMLKPPERLQKIKSLISEKGWETLKEINE